MPDIITYETIRAAHRAEKEEKLQKLPMGFFSAVRQWIEHKSMRRDTQSMLEIESAKKVLEDLLNRREKKIVLSALHTVRGDIPPDGLTEEEQKFFDQLVFSFKNFKDEMQQQMWSYDKFVEEKISEVKKLVEDLQNPEDFASSRKPKVFADLPLQEEMKSISKNSEEFLRARENQKFSPINQIMEKEKISEPAPLEIVAEKIVQEKKKIKILTDLPQFIGADLNYYGPFLAGQTVDLPTEVAGLLSMRGAAEVVS